MVNIVGTWRLIGGKTWDKAGAERPPPYNPDGLGVVVLGADGRMVAVLCAGGPAAADGKAREYVSYCGEWRLEADVLTTRVDATSDPARMGTDQVRKVRFDGDIMVLTPPTRTVGGVLEHREIYWKKLSGDEGIPA